MKFVRLVGCGVYSVKGTQYRKADEDPTMVDDDTFRFLMTRRNSEGHRYFEDCTDAEVEVEEETTDESEKPVRENVTKVVAKEATTGKGKGKEKPKGKTKANAKPLPDDGPGIPI